MGEDWEMKTKLSNERDYIITPILRVPV